MSPAFEIKLDLLVSYVVSFVAESKGDLKGNVLRKTVPRKSLLSTKSVIKYYS